MSQQCVGYRGGSQEQRGEDDRPAARRSNTAKTSHKEISSSGPTRAVSWSLLMFDPSIVDGPPTSNLGA